MAWIAAQAICGSERYRDAETIVPATCLAASFELHCAVFLLCNLSLFLIACLINYNLAKDFECCV